MAVSHSFAGEHVEDGGGEKPDAERDHHDIKHGEYLLPTVYLVSGAPEVPVPSRDQLTAANERSRIKIRCESLYSDISKP
jgi:hypothetical protein